MAPSRLKKERLQANSEANRRAWAELIRESRGPDSELPPLERYADKRQKFLQAVSVLYHQLFVLENSKGVDEYFEIEKTSNPSNVPIIGAMLWKDRGAALIKEGKYGEARAAYAKALQYALALDHPYDTPSPSPVIPALEQGGEDEYFDAIGSANNIAFCYLKENNIVETLAWLHEVECMHKSFVRGTAPPMNPWTMMIMPYEEFLMMRIKGFLRQGQAFDALGNSAASCWATHTASKHAYKFFPANKKLQDECPFHLRGTKRHPSPEDVETLKISEPSLQVRGTWKKIALEGGPPTRKGHVSVLCKGKLYVFGNDRGAPSSPKASRLDSRGWKLDLKNVSSGWSRVPHPTSPITDAYYDRLVVHKNKAYLFQGRRTIDVFDFHAETWSQITTEMKKGEWKTYFPTNLLLAFAVEVYEDKMYVFGGRDNLKGWGSNLFVVLDLNTRQWEHLSGTVEIVPDYSCPSLRAHVTSWVSDGKFYITLGTVNRSGGGGIKDHHYHDLWSYDISKNLWAQEKMSGNPPCIRSQTAHTFNSTWNRAIVFGGYCGELLYRDPDGDNKTPLLTFSLFADTFIWSPESKTWSQVIARGFPTYRCCANMMTDAETGKTYLFGGFTNTYFTPSHSSSTQRFFTDLWELTVDVPGGGFVESEFEPDPRFSKLGPYVRCFNCGSIGRWKMCAGSCKTTDEAAAFCGTECQKVAWPEHKQHCRKV